MGAPPELAGEPRWPPATAVLAFIAFSVVLRLVLPSEQSLGPVWLIPLVEGWLLVVLLASNHAELDRRSRSLRRALLVLVWLLVAAALWATVVLVARLITGGGETNSPGPLLAAGALVLAGNNLAFALLYWGLDCGGPAIRAAGLPRHPDFAFPQQLNPELAPPGWRPAFLDYVYVAFTNSTAFSPTDAMPMTHWAKLTMVVQALVSLAIIGLVVARAVNVLT